MDWSTKLPSEEMIHRAWDYTTKVLLDPRTDQLYDFPVDDVRECPLPEETARSWPNPCGYATGTEDAMIHAGTMLDACLCRYEMEEDEESCMGAHRLVAGMLRCAFASDVKGFLPRGVMPADGKSHYIDSSRDQYTLFVFGAFRYLHSTICTEKERVGLIISPFTGRSYYVFTCNVRNRGLCPHMKNPRFYRGVPFVYRKPLIEKHSDFSFNFCKGPFFKSGNLCLRDADLFGNFNLGLALEKTEGNNLFLSVVELGERFPQGDLVNPVAIIGVVRNLIHDVNSISAVGENRLVEGYRIDDGFQRQHNTFPGKPDFFSNFHDRWLLA